MWRLRSLASHLRGLFSGRRLDRELSAEIDDHLRLLTERFIGQGLAPRDARQAARRQFGGITQLQEHLREERGAPFFENLARDLAFSMRMARKQPGFSMILIGILALGIGANTAVFSLVNGILLHPLHFPHPEKLVALFERNVVNNGDVDNPVAPANYLDWRKQTTALDEIAAISYARLNLSGAADSIAPERIDVCACSANLFDTLGVAPAIGRSFRPDEDVPGARTAVIISDALWKRRFDASPAVLSSTIKLDSRFYTVIGVMPADFSYPARSIDAWIPLETWLAPVVLQAHDNHVLTVIGRLRAGFSIAQAKTEIDAMMRRYKSEHPSELAGSGANVAPLAEVEVRGVQKLSLLLFGAVTCVLLIACVNVANLLLSRSAGRKREMAIRAALGAGRGRVFRQLLIETVVMSLLGGVAGAALAVELIQYLTTWAPGAAWLPQAVIIRTDPTILVFSLGLALIAGVLAGLLPAFESTSSLDIARNLKDTGRSATAGGSLNRFRDALIAAEVALSLTLLVAAGLLMRSFAGLVSADLGLRTTHRLTMRLSLPDGHYHERSQVAAFLKRLSAQLRSAPGVIDVGLTSCPVVTLPGFCPDTTFEIENRAAPAGHMMDAQYRGANPEFFRAAGIPIMRGRSLALSDGIGVDDKHPLPGAAVINQALAKKFFASQEPIGRFITLDWFVGNNTERSRLRYQIVGISGDVHERPQSPALPTFYVPLLDGDSTEISIVLHSQAAAGAVAAAARAAVRGLDADLALFAIQSMDDSRGETTLDQKFVVSLLAAFAGIAVILATVGLYGVVSWGVSQRRKEIAIRIALGASAREVHWMVLSRGLRPAAWGILIGIPAAASVARLMQGLLFGVRQIDPVTFTLVPLLLLAITVLASSLPAIRATRVDPTIGLRVD